MTADLDPAADAEARYVAAHERERLAYEEWVADGCRFVQMFSNGVMGVAPSLRILQDAEKQLLLPQNLTSLLYNYYVLPTNYHN